MTNRPTPIDDANLWTERRAALQGGERRFYQAILRRFADGTAATHAELERVGRELELDADATFRRLAELDLVRLDADGEVAVAYPFSASPTPHRLRIGGKTVNAMCAVDALGVAYMLDRAIEIRSVDPVAGREVTVTVHPARGASWEPREAVVFVGGRAGVGPAAALCCPLVNFFASRDSAETYLSRERGLVGEIASVPEALARGRAIFGAALAEEDGR